MKVDFAIAIRGYAEGQRDDAFQFLKDFEASLGLASQVSTDILGAGPKERVECYTSGAVDLPGGWAALAEHREQLDAQAKQRFGSDVRVELERL